MVLNLRVSSQLTIVATLGSILAIHTLIVLLSFPQIVRQYLVVLAGNFVSVVLLHTTLVLDSLQV